MGRVCLFRASGMEVNTTPLPRPMTYMHHEAHVVLPELRAAGIRRAVLIGHSDGGSIAAICRGTPICRSQSCSGIPQQEAARSCDRLSVSSHHRRILRRRISTSPAFARLHAYASGDLRQPFLATTAHVSCVPGWNDARPDPRFRASTSALPLPAYALSWHCRAPTILGLTTN